MQQNTIEKHTPLQSVVLHLLPGILTGGFYFLARQPLMRLGYPPVFALVVAAALVLVPVELGFLLWQGRNRNGRYTLQGVICYRQAIPWWQTLLWVLGVFVVTGAIFTLLKPVDAALKAGVFAWMPALENGLDGQYSRSVLTVTYALFFIFIAVLGPLVEELYFRGYLLPRTPGRFATVLHSFLFAAYHVFTPWMIVTRTLGLLPLVYAVQKKNLYVGMIVHVLVNTLDVVTAAAFILQMA